MYRARGIDTLILDPDKCSDWDASFITSDPDEFLTVVKSNRSCAIFVDEAGYMIGRYGGAMQWLATNSRKWGHKAYFITQRANQLDVNIRNMCSSVFIFKQSLDDTKILSREFVSEEIKQAHTLKKGEYIAKIGVDGQAFKAKAF